MTHNYQTIINETDNPSFNNLTITWKCEQVIDETLFNYTHRDIKINSFGNPVLRMYAGEVKRIYKELYCNGEKVSNYIDNPNKMLYSEFDENDSDITLWVFDNKEQLLVAYIPGTYILKSSIVNNYFDLSKYNDSEIANINVKDLVVIVEDKPIITKVELMCNGVIMSNPFYHITDDLLAISYKLTYSNGDIEYKDIPTWTKYMHITNKVHLMFFEDKIYSTLDPGVTYLIFDIDRLKEENPEYKNAHLPEKLKIIVCDNKEIPEYAESEFVYITDKQIVEVGNFINLSFKEKVITKDPNIIYEYELIGTGSLNITSNADKILLEKNKITGLHNGNVRIKFITPLVDFNYYLDIDKITYNIRVVEVIKNVLFYIDKNELNVGDTCGIYVKLVYSDDTETTFLTEADFKLSNQDIISIDKTCGTIKALKPGEVTISLNTDIFPEGVAESVEDIHIKVIQPITKMWFDKTELHMIIGDKEQLLFDYEPENASIADLEWTSSESDVVSVDNEGNLEALSRGNSIIMVSEKAKTNKIIDDATGEEIEITLPKDLYITDSSYFIGETDEKGYVDLGAFKCVITNNKKNAIEKATVELKNQMLYIYPPNTIETLSYNNVVYINVKDYFNNNIRNYPVKYCSGIYTFVNMTDKNGNTEFYPLSKVFTNNYGEASLDGLKINLKCNNSDYADSVVKASITHTDLHTVYISLSNYIDFDSVMNKLLVTITTNNDKKVSDLNLIISMPKEPDSSTHVLLYNNIYKESKNEDCLIITDDLGEDYVPDNKEESDPGIMDTPTDAEPAEPGIGEEPTPDWETTEDNTSDDEDIFNWEIIEDITDPGIMDLPTDAEPSEPSIGDETFIIIDYVLADITNRNTDLIYDPTKCAVCNVTVTAIEVTGLKFNTSSITLDKDMYDSFEPAATIQPENATYPGISYYIEDENIAKFDSLNEVYGYKIGTTKLIAVSEDNPDIKAELIINVVSHKVQKVTITTPANDTDYEWYDQLNLQTDSEKLTTYGTRVTTEKYDDDDFKRFYLPINNSMQLTASVEPEDANDTNIMWLSSNSSLLKINNKGIMTALKEDVREDLDVYGDDYISETRFANTVWVTALNTRYGKYDVCHVRVTQNNIIKIDVDEPDEHDRDIDDINEYGNYHYKSEHEVDYVINVGETIEIPITLTSQDDNFGPSNFIKWDTKMKKQRDIISIKGGSPNHDNALEDDFDWNTTSVEAVNTNKSTPTLYVTGENIGDAVIVGKTYVDSNKSITDPQLYVPRNSLIGESDKFGNVYFNLEDKRFDGFTLNLKYHSKSSKILNELKETLIKKLHAQLDNVVTTGTVTMTFGEQQMEVIKNGTCRIERVVEDLVDKDYIYTEGIFMEGVKATRTTDGKIYLEIPNILTATDFYTNKYKTYKHTFKYSPTISLNSNINIETAADMTTYRENTDDYISVTAIGMTPEVREKLTITPIYLNGYYLKDNKPKKTTWGSLVTMLNVKDGSTVEDIGDKESEHTGRAFFPSKEHTNNDILQTYDEYNHNPWDAKPGTGQWIMAPSSREIKIRVVATPKNIYIGGCNAYNNELHIGNRYTSPCTLDRWPKREYKYMIVGYDNDFKELLTLADIKNRELDDKYKAFAWFSDNEEVIRFEDVEDLTYTDEDGNLTNDPNESYQTGEIETIDTRLTNLHFEKYEGYQQVNNNISLKFTENYPSDYSGGHLATDDTLMSVIKITPIVDGILTIRYQGKIAINNIESLNGAKVETSTNTSDYSFDVKIGNTYYVMGASQQTYIESVNLKAMLKVDFGASFDLIFNDLDIHGKYEKNAFTQINKLVSLNIAGGCSNDYTDDEGLLTDNKSITTIKLTPTYDGDINIYFDKGNLKITDKNKTLSHTASQVTAPYVIKAKAGNEYYLTGDSSSKTIVKRITYTGITDEPNIGSYKGTIHFKVKPSYIKRVICEGKGTANVYVISPKGQVSTKLKVIIE